MVRLGRLAALAVGVLAVASISLAATFAAAAGSTVKSTTTVSIKPQATLVTSLFGPGADVTITYSCFPTGGGGKGGYPGGGAFGSINVVDLQGHQGFGSFTPICDDTRNTAVVFVFGNFMAGSGAANAFVCGFDCASASREIKLS
jgi:hypothetical protein